MAWFQRIAFFAVVNLLVLTTLNFTWIFVERYFGLEGSGYGYIIYIGTAFGMGGALISLFMSKWTAKKFMGVQIVDRNTSDNTLRWVVESVHHYSKAAGLTTMPEVGVYDSPDMNAFATGPTKSNSLVAVSTGLLRQMRQEEVEGVLAHEVAHIANGDMVTMTLLQGVINSLVLIVSRVIANIIVNSGDRDRGFMSYFLVSMVLQIALTILGSIVVNFFSRWREYRADAGGARLAGRDKMISALQALSQVQPMKEPHQEAVAALKISGGSLAAIFSTHPPLEKRIRALQRARV